MPKILFLIPIFWKCGTAESIKEAMTMEVKTTKAKSRKTHNKNTPRITKKTRIIVPVVTEMCVTSRSFSLLNIET